MSGDYSRFACFEPLADQIILLPDQDPKLDGARRSGIVLPDSVQQTVPKRGVVVAVGPGRKLDDGEHVPMALAVGDRVLYSGYGYAEFDWEDEHGSETLVSTHETEVFSKLR